MGEGVHPTRSAAVPAARPVAATASEVSAVGGNEPAGWANVAAGDAAGAAHTRAPPQRGSGILPLFPFSHRVPTPSPDSGAVLPREAMT